jgi:hypothetical protein
MEKREDYYVKLRGLPFDIEKKEVLEFLSSLKYLTEDDIAYRFTYNGGFSGLAFVKLQSEEDQTEAKSFHKKYLGKRYVEVFASNETEFNSAMHTKTDTKDST